MRQCMIVETYASSVIFLFCFKNKLEMAQCGFEAHVSEKCARDVKMGDKAARRPSPARFSIPLTPARLGNICFLDKYNKLY